MDYREFAKKIREKYPNYNNVDDEELVRKFVDKFPVYKGQVTFEKPIKKGLTYRPFANLGSLLKRAGHRLGHRPEEIERVMKQSKYEIEGWKQWTKGYWDAVSKGKIDELQKLERRLSEERRNPIDWLSNVGLAGIAAGYAVELGHMLEAVPQLLPALRRARPALAKQIEAKVAPTIIKAKVPPKEKLVIIARWNERTMELKQKPAEEIRRIKEGSILQKAMAAPKGELPPEHIGLTPEETTITQSLSKPALLKLIKQSKAHKLPMKAKSLAELRKLSKSRQAYEGIRKDIGGLEAVRVPESEANKFFAQGGGSPLEFAKRMQQEGKWVKILSPTQAIPKAVTPPVTPPPAKPTGLGGLSEEPIRSGQIILPKYANNINLTKLPKELQQPVAEFITDKPMLGKTPSITNQQLIEKTVALKNTPTMKYLLDQPEGQLAAEALKIRQGSMETITKVLSKDLNSLKTEMDTTIARALEQYRRVGAETGRALQQFNIPVEIRKNLLAQIGGKIRQVREDPLFRDNKALIDGLKALKKQIATKDLTPSVFDYIFRGWMEAILSDPRTHMVNVASNTVFAAGKIPEKFFQALVDLPISVFTGKRTAYFGEIPAMVRGLMSAGKVPIAAGSKLEGHVPMLKGIGRVLPTELLRIEDIVGKNMVGRMEKYALAYRTGIAMRKGTHKGLTGLGAIRKEELYRTFQDESGAIYKGLSKLRRAVPGIRYILPFLRTPASIINKAIERTPLGVGFVWKAGTQAEFSQKLGLLLGSSLISTWVGYQYLKGNITGDAPTKENEREQFYAVGKQPNSIKIFGHWVPFGRLEPVGTGMAIVVNLIQDYRDSDKQVPVEKAFDATIGLFQSLTNKTYLSGMTNTMKAVADPERYGEPWYRRFVSSFAAPGLLNAIGQWSDPYIRRPETIKETIKSRLPGLSKQVRPRLTAFGEPVKRKTPGLPVRVSKPEITPLRTELDRLGLFVGFPSKTVGKVKMSPDEYHRFVKESGPQIKKTLERIVASPHYKTMPDELKIKVINQAIQAGRTMPRFKATVRAALRQLKEIRDEKKKAEYLARISELTRATVFVYEPKYIQVWQKHITRK